MKKTLILSLSLVAVILSISITPAFAAQMDVRIDPTMQTSVAEIKYQRTVFIEYENGGQVADIMRGQTWSKVFTADSTTPGVNELRDRVNYYLKNTAGSDAAVTDIKIDYDATLTGRDINTSIDYKIIIEYTLTNHVIRQQSGNSPGIIDMDWRGIVIPGDVQIFAKGMNNEINLPISVIHESAPELGQMIRGSEAETILNNPIIDSTGIKSQPLGNWHFLFDPTGINVDASQFGMSEELAGKVWSSFTMGESSIREGRQVERIQEASFTADTTYPVRTIQSSDAANVFISGFATVDVLGGSEVYGVTAQAPEGYATTSTGEFPMMIIYGMAGMAALGGAAVFVISERKRRYETTHNTQTGIDPSQLRASSTSTGAGGYKTNRGEAELIDGDYAQHRSVYDQQQIEQKAEPEPTPEPAPEPTPEPAQVDNKEKEKEEIRKQLEELKKQLKKK